MKKDLKTELYKAIKGVDATRLSEDDKSDLLRMFKVVQNSLIRDQIAFIFNDINYHKAVPHILKRINERKAYNNNSSLVFALLHLEVNDYFADIVKIIYEHEFGSRLEAYHVIKKITPSVAEKDIAKALVVLKKKRKQLKREATDKGENSTLHFVEETIHLLRSGVKKKNNI